MTSEPSPQESLYLYSARAISETIPEIAKEVDNTINNSTTVEILSQMLLFTAGAFLSHSIGSSIFELLGTSSNVLSNECLGVSFFLLALLIVSNRHLHR